MLSKADSFIIIIYCVCFYVHIQTYKGHNIHEELEDNSS